MIPFQAELGDIVYVELPEVGSEVKQGEQFGVIESVKVNLPSYAMGEAKSCKQEAEDRQVKEGRE